MLDIAIFNQDINEYVKKRNNLKDNIKLLYSILWKQLSKPMQPKLVDLKYFKDFDDLKDSATLLMETKSIYYEYKGHRNP